MDDIVIFDSSTSLSNDTPRDEDIIPIVSCKENVNEIVINYQFRGFLKHKLRHRPFGGPIEFGPIKIPHVGYKVTNKKPLLPSFGRFVRIPPNHNWKIVPEFNKKSLHVLDFHLIPSQEELTDFEKSEAISFYDEEFYSSTDWYPEDEELVDISGPYYINNGLSLLIHVRPFQYKPKTRELQCYGEVIVKVRIEPSEDEESSLTPIPSLLNKVLNNFHVNPETGIEDNNDTKLGLETIGDNSESTEYLILYHPKFRNAATLLKEHKDKRNIITEAISVATALDEKDTEEFQMRESDVQRLKDYVRIQKSNNNNLKYLLLFGDIEKIKTDIHRLSDQKIPAYPTDHYFSTRADLISDFAEDNIPWLTVGRIPVRDAASAENIVKKIINYEEECSSDPDRILFAGYFQDTDYRLGSIEINGQECRQFIRTLEKIRKTLINKKKYISGNLPRIYVNQYSKEELEALNIETLKYITGEEIPKHVDQILKENSIPKIRDEIYEKKVKCITEDLIKEINMEPLIVAYRGHGSWDGMVKPKLQLHEDSTLKCDLEGINSNSIFFCTTCLIGKFNCKDDHKARSRSSFAEAILKRKTGSASLVAASTESRSWRNDSLLEAMFDAIYGDLLQLFPSQNRKAERTLRLGDILNYAKMYLLTEHEGLTQGNKEHFELYHVFGDPTIPVYWKLPRP